MEIIDYTIIEKYSSVELEKSVLKFSRDGWEPLGGVSLCLYKNRKIYTQAVIIKK